MTGLFQDGHYGVVADRVCWSVFALTSVIVSLRLFCRVRTRTSSNFLGAVGLDDLVTIICLLIILSACILISIASSWGLGQHFDSLDSEHRAQAMKFNAVIDAVIIWGFSSPKFAIVCLLKRILNHGLKTTILFWTLAIVGQVVILSTSIWVFRQCSPVEYQWDQYRGDPNITGTCAPVYILTDIGYFGSSYSAFLDVFFAVYPVPFIMKLRLPMKQRVYISMCMSLGAVASGISIYKLSILGTAFAIMGNDPTCQSQVIALPGVTSLTIALVPIPYLNTLGLSEACVLIICGSLPALGPLFRSSKRRRVGYSDSGSRHTYRTEENNTSGGKHQWLRIDGQRHPDLEATTSSAGAAVYDIPLAKLNEKSDKQYQPSEASFEIPKTLPVGSTHY